MNKLWNTFFGFVSMHPTLYYQICGLQWQSPMSLACSYGDTSSCGRVVGIYVVVENDFICNYIFNFSKFFNLQSLKCSLALLYYNRFSNIVKNIMQLWSFKIVVFLIILIIIWIVSFTCVLIAKFVITIISCCFTTLEPCGFLCVLLFDEGLIAKISIFFMSTFKVIAQQVFTSL